jgi:hypothetical protein
MRRAARGITNAIVGICVSVRCQGLSGSSEIGHDGSGHRAWSLRRRDSRRECASLRPGGEVAELLDLTVVEPLK